MEKIAVLKSFELRCNDLYIHTYVLTYTYADIRTYRETDIHTYILTYVCMHLCVYEYISYIQTYVRCRYLIPALNALATRAYTTTRPIATQPPGHGCMDDLKTEGSFDLQATWLIGVLGLLF